MGPVKEVDLHEVLAFNGRGDVKVLEESNGGSEHRYRLHIAGSKVIDYTITPEPHTPGTLDRYRYFQEDLYFPTLNPDFVSKNPKIARNYLARVYGPHLQLAPGLQTREAPLLVEPHPYLDGYFQIHIPQGIMVTIFEENGSIERLVRSEKLLAV